MLANSLIINFDNNFHSKFSNKGKARRGIADGGPDDDGDYATLRELPLMSGIDPADDSTSEENKVNVLFYDLV